jgi:hypothetical protein
MYFAERLTIYHFKINALRWDMYPHFAFAILHSSKAMKFYQLLDTLRVIVITPVSHPEGIAITAFAASLTYRI